MFYDDKGKVIIDPTALRETKSIQVDTVEYQNLLKLMEMDPNGTAVRIANYKNSKDVRGSKLNIKDVFSRL